MQLSELQRILKKTPTCPFRITKSMYRSRVHYDRVFVVDTLEEVTPRYEGERKRTLAHGTLYIRVPGTLAHHRNGEHVPDAPPMIKEQKTTIYTKDIFEPVMAENVMTGAWEYDIEVWQADALRDMWKAYTRLVLDRDEESRFLERLQSAGIDVSFDDISQLTSEARNIINQLLNRERTPA